MGRRGGGVVERLRAGDYSGPDERDQLLQKVRTSGDVALADVAWMVTDRDPVVRSAGLTLIKDLKDPATVEYFIKTWDELPQVSRQAVARAMERLAPEGWERTLEPFLDHRNEGYRKAAAEIVEASPMNPRIRRLLERQVDRSEGDGKRRALGRLLDQPEEAEPEALLQHLTDPDEKMRGKVIRALAARGDARYLEHFAARLEVETYALQQQLVGVFLDYAKAGHDVTTYLLPLLSGGDPTLRQTAVKILTRMPDRTRVVREFIQYSKTLSGWVRQRALETLVEFQVDLFEPTLELLADSDPAVRASAIHLASTAKGDPRLEAALVPMLRDSDWWVRVCAAEALGEVGSTAAVAALVELLDDTDTRWSALDALARLGDPSCLGRLVKLLKTAEPEVRAEVVKVLPKFGDQRLAEVLKRVCTGDASAEVRADAFAALRELQGDALRADEAATLERGVDLGAGDPGREATPLARLLLQAREVGASDVHLTVGRPPLVRLRGELIELEGHAVLSARAVLSLLEPMLTPAQHQHLETAGSVEVLEAVPEQGRYRGSLFIDQHGLNGVFRVIPNKVPSLLDIGLPPYLAEMSSWHQGLILLVGPAGSGKTTTLAALVDLINERRASHIVTVEDPIEYVHHFKRSLINQRQLKRDTASYSRALRAALREDPDVVVLGEMRDLETTKMAIEASETGHLVIATMNGTSAQRAVDRTINAFPPDEQAQIRMMLADTLKLVLGQMLMPRADGQGRVAVFEVLLGLPTVAAVIRENKTVMLSSLMQTGRRLGMRTQDDSLEELIEQGLVAPEQAWLRAHDKRRFEAFVSNEFLQGVLA